MKFYYWNSMGDSGIFSEQDLIKAIYSVWNVEGNLYLIDSNYEGKLTEENILGVSKLIFAPWESNEFNSELLKEFGYYMEDGNGHREIKDIKTHEVKRYDWSEVRLLI